MKDLERPFCCREKKSKTHENNQMIILIRRIMSRPTCCMPKGFKFQALTLLAAALQQCCACRLSRVFAAFGPTWWI